MENYLEVRIIAMLNEAGIKNVTFHIEDINLHEVKLSGISIGKENPLLLQSVSLKYSPNEVMAGSLKDVTLSGLHLEARETEQGWIFTGMDILPEKTEQQTMPLDLPAILNSLPFSSIKIDDSDLRISGKSIEGIIPFSLELSDKITLSTKAAQISAGANTLNVGEVSLSAAPDENKEKWNGTWAAKSLSAGSESPVPEMAGSGTLQIEQSVVKLPGQLISADKPTERLSTAFSMFSNASKNQIKLTSASLPFKQGTVSTKNVILKLPMTIPLSIQKVSMDDLLQSLTGQKVSATGTVSGFVPLIIAKDGSYSFGQGSLKSDSTGRITMPGDVIPGDNEQVSLVRQILENLHYAVLSAGVKSGKDGKMTVELHLEGNNPDVYNGRQVKLNINLTGDVLDIVRQNIMLFKNPEKLLEQGNDE